MSLRIGFLISHPIQYYTPIFRALAGLCDLTVFFAHRQTAAQQANAGFGVAFEWDIDLLSGYHSKFLDNVSRQPSTEHFSGCDTPGISREIADGGFDAFVVPGWGLRSYLQAAQACRHNGVPVFVRGDSQLVGQRRILVRIAKALLFARVLRRFDGFLYVGQRNRDYLLHYGAPRERLFFSPHCVDNVAFAAASAAARQLASGAVRPDTTPKRILFVGKLVGRKHPLDVLRAASLLAKQGMALEVAFAGSGELEPVLRDVARAEAVPTVFHGFVNQSEMPSVYAASDVMVLPSDALETWGLAVNEGDGVRCPGGRFGCRRLRSGPRRARGHWGGFPCWRHRRVRQSPGHCNFFGSREGATTACFQNASVLATRGCEGYYASGVRVSGTKLCPRVKSVNPMRNNVSAINPAYAPRRHVETRLDYSFLQRISLAFGIVTVLGDAVLAGRDPVAFAVGGAVPTSLDEACRPNPTMPAAVAYFLLWQWMQSFTRVLQGLIDGETLSASIYGPWVEQAYWYTLASTVTLAVAFRLVLGRMRAPTPAMADAHRGMGSTRPDDALSGQRGDFPLSAAMRRRAVPVAQTSHWRPLLHLKILAMSMLFATVLATGKGRNVLIAVLVVETLSGFGGLFSDFKGAFIYLAITAIAVRIRWTGKLAAVSVAMLAIMVVMSLWWTAVKTDFREFATGSSDSQSVKTDFSSRIGYLGNKTTGGIDWDGASYALLLRLSYVDIFGSVIGVQLVSPEPGYFRQWQEAVEHVVKPRFLFPDKAALSDTEVFIRLARGNASESFRMGTSISVGFIAENYVDMGFPTMLAGIFAIGCMVGGVLRYFMTRSLPWMVREGIALALIYTFGHDGVEISLPKILGAAIMSFGVWAIMIRWGFPIVIKWLGRKQCRPNASSCAGRKHLVPPGITRIGFARSGLRAGDCATLYRPSRDAARRSQTLPA